MTKVIQEKSDICHNNFLSAFPEPGPRPLKSEEEIENGKEAIKNKNIIKTKNVETDLGEEEDNTEETIDEQTYISTNR